MKGIEKEMPPEGGISYREEELWFSGGRHVRRRYYDHRPHHCGRRRCCDHRLRRKRDHHLRIHLSGHRRRHTMALTWNDHHRRRMALSLHPRMALSGYTRHRRMSVPRDGCTIHRTKAPDAGNCGKVEKDGYRILHCSWELAGYKNRLRNQLCHSPGMKARGEGWSSFHDPKPKHIRARPLRLMASARSRRREVHFAHWSAELVRSGELMGARNSDWCFAARTKAGCHP